MVRLALGAIAVGFVSGLPVLSGTFSPASQANAPVTLQAFPTGTPCTYEDSWRAPRGTDASGKPLYHEGVDVIARTGTPVYAASAGRITRLSTSNRGGIQLYLTRSDGTYFFHAHLSGYAPGLKVGDTVAAGQLIAYVGQTGDAVYSVPHLHFEVHPGGGAPVNPYPIVRAVDACYGSRPPATTAPPPPTTSPRSTNPRITAPPTTPATTAAPQPRNTTTVPNVGGTVVRGGTGGGAGPSTPDTTAPTPEPPAPDVPATVGPPGGLVPLAPARLADSRRSNGVSRLAGGQTVALAVAGRGGVPADASAAWLSVTVTAPSAAGYLTAFPCGTPVPRTSTVNFVAGQTVTNAALVGLGTGDQPGQVCLRSNVATDVMVDVGAYASAAETVGFSPMSPRRLVDTRETAAVTPETVLQIAVGTPGVRGVSLNVTSVDAAGSGSVTVWPCASPRPATPTLVVGGGDIVPNTTTTALGADGLLCAATTTTTDLIVDLLGTWQADGLRPSAVMPPVRLLDTRERGVRVPAGGIVTVPVAGVRGLPAGLAAAQFNITSVDTRADGYVTVWPCGQARPTASNLNPVAGRILANGALVGLGDGGAVCVYSHSATHLVVDVTGVLG